MSSGFTNCRLSLSVRLLYNFRMREKIERVGTNNGYGSLRLVVETTEPEPAGRLGKFFYDHWRRTRSSSADYSATFNRLFEPPVHKSSPRRKNITREISRSDRPNYLRELVERKKIEQIEVLVLDLMGYGYVTRDLGVRGCAVGLTDKRSSKAKEFDESVGNGFVAGNIRRAKTWRGMRNWLEEQEPGKKFDLILCRPIAGMRTLPQDESFYAYTLKSLYGMLSSEDGHLLSEFHWSMQDTVEEAVEKLSRINGVETRFSVSDLGQQFMLIKHPTAPEVLDLNSI